MDTKTELYDQIIAHFTPAGGKPHHGEQILAKALNIHRESLRQWQRRIPPLRAYEIERLTWGKFKADDIIAARETAR